MGVWFLQKLTDVCPTVTWDPCGATRAPGTPRLEPLSLFLLDCLPLCGHPSLLSPGTAWVCSWELREGLGDRGLFLETRNGARGGALVAGGACRILLGFSSPFSLVLLNSEGNKDRTRKGREDWMACEVNPKFGRGTQLQGTSISGGLGFRGTQFQGNSVSGGLSFKGTTCSGLFLLIFLTSGVQSSE